MGLLDDAIREHLDLKRRRGADPAEVERAEREALGPVRRGPGTAEQSDTEAEQEGGANGGLTSDQTDDPEWLEHDEDWTEADDRTRILRPDHAEESHAAFAEGHDLVDESVAESPAAERPVAERDPLGGERGFDDVGAEHGLDQPEDAAPGPSGAIPTPHPADPPAPEGRPPASSLPPPVEPAAPAFPEHHHGDQTAEYDVASELHDEPAPADEPWLDDEPGHAGEREGAAESGRHDESQPPEPPPKTGEDVLEETPEFLQDTPDHDRLWFEQRPPRDFDFDK